MAYGLFLHFDFDNVRVEIHRRDFSGSATQINQMGATPVVIDGLNDRSVSVTPEIIIKSTATLTIRDNGEVDYEQLFTADSQKYMVVIKEDDATVWSGYITPDSFSTELENGSFFTIIARDNLGYLDQVDFTWGTDFAPVGGIINEAMSVAGVLMPWEWALHVWECESKYITVVGENTHVKDAMVNTRLFDGMSWWGVLEELFRSLALQMRYVGQNKLLLVMVSDLYNVGNVGGRTIDIEYTATAGGTRQIIPSLREVKVEQDYGLIEEYLTKQTDSEDYQFAKRVNNTIQGVGARAGGDYYSLLESSGWRNSEGANPVLFALASTREESEVGDKYLYLSGFNRVEDEAQEAFVYYDFPMDVSMDVSLKIRTNSELFRGYASFVGEELTEQWIGSTERGSVVSYEVRAKVLWTDTVGAKSYLTADGWSDAIGDWTVIRFTGEYDRNSTEGEVKEWIINVGTPQDARGGVTGTLTLCILPFKNDAVAYGAADGNVLLRIESVGVSITSVEDGGLEVVGQLNAQGSTEEVISAKVGQVPAASGDYISFLGGFFEGSSPYRAALRSWRRSDNVGGILPLSELVGRAYAHLSTSFTSSSGEIIGGTLYEMDIKFDGATYFGNSYTINGNRYILTSASYDMRRKKASVLLRQVVPYFHSGAEFEANVVDSGGGISLAGGESSVVTWSATGSGVVARRIYELPTAGTTEGMYLLVDALGQDSAKKVLVSDLPLKSHASTHAKGGSDEITPGEIGAANEAGDPTKDFSARTLNATTVEAETVNAEVVNGEKVVSDDIESEEFSTGLVTKGHKIARDPITGESTMFISTIKADEIISDLTTIQEVRAVGGVLIVSQADAKVVRVDGLRCYYIPEAGGQVWRVDDQALCKVPNKYYWSLVEAVSTTANEAGEHWFELSDTIKVGTVSPAVGDNVLLCGARGEDITRQNVTIISSGSLGYENPYTYYEGVNTFSLAGKELIVLGGDLTRITTNEFVIRSSDGIKTAQPNDRGKWSEATYYANDRVSHNGDYWTAIAITTDEPTTNSIYWERDTQGVHDLVIGSENLYSTGDYYRDMTVYAGTLPALTSITNEGSKRVLRYDVSDAYKGQYKYGYGKFAAGAHTIYVEAKGGGSSTNLYAGFRVYYTDGSWDLMGSRSSTFEALQLTTPAEKTISHLNVVFDGDGNVQIANLRIYKGDKDGGNNYSAGERTAGKNLFLNSGNSETKSTYNLGNRYVSDNLVVGQQYTLVLDSKTQGGQKIDIYSSGGYMYLSSIPADYDGVYVRTFTYGIYEDKDYNYITFYSSPSASASSNPTTIRWSALYEGDVDAPEYWQAAPEDLQKGIDDAQAAASEAQEDIAAMNADTIFDITEKHSIRDNWFQIQGAANTTESAVAGGSYYAAINQPIGNADPSEVTEAKNTLTTAYVALRNSLNTLELYIDVNTPGFNREGLSGRFATYHNAEQEVYKVISKGIQGDDGTSVFIAYSESVSKPAKPTGDGTTGGWQREATELTRWMSTKSATTINEGEWGDPMPTKGADGTSVVILDSLESEEQLPATGSLGEAYMVAGDLHIWTEAGRWKNVGRIKGDAGESSYVHIKYSNDGGQSFSGEGGDWLGTLTSMSSTASAIPSDYSWSLIKGEKGDSGIGVAASDVEFAKNTSPTVAPTSGWSTTSPAWESGSYIWQRLKTTFTDGNFTTSEPANVTGARGSNGAPGDTGNGIANVVEQYYLSTSKTEQVGGEWVTTSPTWENGKYIWIRSQITYTDGEVVYAGLYCDSSWEAVNEVQIGGVNLLVLKDSTLNYIVAQDQYISRSGQRLFRDIPIKGGSQYAISTAETNTEYIRVSYWTADKVYIDWFVSTKSEIIITTPSNAAYLSISIPLVNNGQLEAGNKVTSWRESPEDVQKRSDDAQAAADEANTRLNDVYTKAQADGIIDQKELNAIQRENAVASKAESDLSKVQGDLETAISQEEEARNSQIAVVNTDIENLQSQIDGVVENWFYEGEPTTANIPASEWTTPEEKQAHVGDTYTNINDEESGDPTAGQSWRWTYTNSTYSWHKIADSDAVKALQEAAKAQSTADGKSSTFLIKPTKYSKGDMWILESAQVLNTISYLKGDLLTANADSATFVAAHWSKDVRYTDDTAVENLQIGGVNLLVLKDSTLNYIVAQDQYIFRSGQRLFKDIPVKSGSQYAISTAETNTEYIRVSYWTADKVYIDWFVSTKSEIIITTPSNAAYLSISFPSVNNGQLEAGNKVTSWKESPEDARDEAVAESANLWLEGGDRSLEEIKAVINGKGAPWTVVDNTVVASNVFAAKLAAMEAFIDELIVNKLITTDGIISIAAGGSMTMSELPENGGALRMSMSLANVEDIDEGDSGSTVPYSSEPLLESQQIVMATFTLEHTATVTFRGSARAVSVGEGTPTTPAGNAGIIINLNSATRSFTQLLNIGAVGNQTSEGSIIKSVLLGAGTYTITANVTIGGLGSNVSITDVVASWANALNLTEWGRNGTAIKASSTDYTREVIEDGKLNVDVKTTGRYNTPGVLCKAKITQSQSVQNKWGNPWTISGASKSGSTFTVYHNIYRTNYSAFVSGLGGGTAEVISENSGSVTVAAIGDFNIMIVGDNQ